MEHIFEHAGVMLRVKYTTGNDGVPTFNDIRMLDEKYRPVGPDMTGFLHTSIVMVDEENAQTFLSAIVEELP